MNTFRPDNPGNSILIVDDILPNLRVLSSMLTNYGYRVRGAPNGPAALAMVSADPPDLILLDIRMPGMDGYEVCQRLKADEKTRDIPVIFISALDELSDKVKSFAMGGVDYVTKPFQVEEVLARVRTHLALRKLQNELEKRVEERTAELAQANASLRTSEERYRYLLERADDGYLIVNGRDQVIYANPQAQLYLDLAGEERELPSRAFRELTRKHYQCEPQEAWANWPSAETPLYLVRPETPTANAFWLQVNVPDVLVSAGGETQRVIHLKDVSEGMALQNEANRFHSMIYHKLRAPLAPIYSGMHFLIDEISTMSQEEILAVAQASLRGVKRLRSEIEDILQYVHAPNLAQPGEAFNLADLESVVAQINADLELGAVMVSVEGELGEIWLVLSQQSVELILREILENAKKFHPNQAPSVEIRVSRSGPHQLRIQVSDDGMTLSPEQLVQVWTPYYQGEKSLSGQVAGMGLGLSLVAIQVWSVGGTCRAFNREDGPGVVVELVLPFCKTRA